MPGERHVLIIGAGLTGLSAASSLMKRGIAVTALESSSQIGGAVHSERTDGFLVEHGPNSMMTNDPAVEEFLRDAGLADTIVQPQAKKRFLVRDGCPIPLPASPTGAVTTPLFSLPGKLRVLAEPFVPRGRTDDESLGDLVRRRLGPEMLAYAIEPFVAGIYAGNPEKLSARYAFPKLWNLEKTHGSFIRGAVRMRRSGPPQKMISFRDGMGELPARLGKILGDRLHCGAHLETIRRGADGRWLVKWTENGTTHELHCDAVVSTGPAFAVAGLPWSDDLRNSLGV